MPYSRSPFDEERYIREYSNLVRRVIRPYFLTGGDYDDLYQEGLIGLLFAIRSYDESKNDNFSAYASLCIKRRVIDAIRRGNSQTARNTHVTGFILEDDPSKHTIYNPEIQILANETAKEIKTKLSDLLSPFESSVLDWYLDGFTSSEIAKETGRTNKSVDNAINRIKRKLADYLSNGR